MGTALIGAAVRRATEVDWVTVSVWGWTMIVVAVVLAVAVLALIVIAIRFLTMRMRVDVPSPRVAAGTEPPVLTGSRPAVQRAPTPVPPENPHAPPTPPGGLTRSGY
jgi:hypothetical protein